MGEPMGQVVIVSEDADLERLIARTARLTSRGHLYRWTWIQPIASQLVRVCTQLMPEVLLLDLRLAPQAAQALADLARAHVTRHPLYIVGLGPWQGQAAFLDQWFERISVQGLDAVLSRR